MVSTVVARAKGNLPVSISWRMTPSEKMSERASAGAPVTCSGDMYPTVPITMPGWVMVMVPSAGAAGW